MDACCVVVDASAVAASAAAAAESAERMESNVGLQQGRRDSIDDDAHLP